MTDVVVYGATAGGRSPRRSRRTRPGRRQCSSSRGRTSAAWSPAASAWTDVGDTRVLGGFARRFYERVARHYDTPLWGVKGPEPHVAEAILTGLLDGVDVRLGETQVPDAAVTSTRATRATCLHAAACRYAVGRESRELYGERWAGRQPAYRPGKHNFSALLSPFADDGTLLPWIREPELDERGWPEERLGEGDGGLQAYGFRVCLTDRPENRVPFEPPDGYDPGAFELLERHLAAADPAAHELLGLVPDLLPNGKCDVNSIGPFSLNVLDGSNREYLRRRPRSVRVRITSCYTQAFLYYLANDAPEAVRAALAPWGLCADEFADTDGWPHQLYVRDGAPACAATTC